MSLEEVAETSEGMFEGIILNKYHLIKAHSLQMCVLCINVVQAIYPLYRLEEYQRVVGVASISSSCDIA